MPYIKTCVKCGTKFETETFAKMKCQPGCARTRPSRARIGPAKPRVQPVPWVIPGEDRAYGGSGLYIDCIPTSSFFKNARSVFRQADWNRTRKTVYERADRACEICGDRPPQVHAHERFSYDLDTGVQRLERLICVCPPCHAVIHFGRTQLMGYEEEALAHYIKVTGNTKWHFLEDAIQYEPYYEELCAREWTLDLSILFGVGLRLNPKFEGRLSA